MYRERKVRTVLTMFLLGIVLLFSGCTKDTVNLKTTTYGLKATDVLGVMGTVSFIQTTPTETTINISLTGAPAGTHPAQLCLNTVVEGGSVMLILNPVGVDGTCSTVVTKISYAQLIAYNGYIRVIQSDQDANVILAEGDIGGNELTSASKTYPLTTVGTYGVTGNALFEKRLNGNTLVTITLNGVLAGNTYDASINLGSIASVGGGPIVKTLGTVDGTTGKSYTDISELNSNLAITYANWLVYDGYINIYTNANEGTVICNGNIGSN